MKIGYIQEHDLELNPHLTKKFTLREANYTRKISKRGDKIYSKMLLFPVDYEDIMDTTRIMKSTAIVITREPFFIDDELREKVNTWIEWANNVSPSEYDPIAKELETIEMENNYEDRKKKICCNEKE